MVQIEREFLLHDVIGTVVLNQFHLNHKILLLYHKLVEMIVHFENIFFVE